MRKDWSAKLVGNYIEVSIPFEYINYNFNIQGLIYSDNDKLRLTIDESVEDIVDGYDIKSCNLKKLQNDLPDDGKLQCNLLLEDYEEQVGTRLNFIESYMLNTTDNKPMHMGSGNKSNQFYNDDAEAYTVSMTEKISKIDDENFANKVYYTSSIAFPIRYYDKVGCVKSFSIEGETSINKPRLQIYGSQHTMTYNIIRYCYDDEYRRNLDEICSKHNATIIVNVAGVKVRFDDEIFYTLLCDIDNNVEAALNEILEEFYSFSKNPDILFKPSFYRLGRCRINHGTYFQKIKDTLEDNIKGNHLSIMNNDGKNIDLSYVKLFRDEFSTLIRSNIGDCAFMISLYDMQWDDLENFFKFLRKVKADNSKCDFFITYKTFSRTGDKYPVYNESNFVEDDIYDIIDAQFGREGFILHIKPDNKKYINLLKLYNIDCKYYAFTNPLTMEHENQLIEELNKWLKKL